MKEIRIYDKVSWHYPEGKGCPDLETAKKHFRILLDWLKKNNLLTDYGKEVYEIGVDSDFTITSDMLNEVGNSIMEKCYKKWLTTFNYGGPVNTSLLDDCF